jgi:hypothetical protein
MLSSRVAPKGLALETRRDDPYTGRKKRSEATRNHLANAKWSLPDEFSRAEKMCDSDGTNLNPGSCVSG